jgi:tetratricopeptide (TPR) repeat protein
VAVIARGSVQDRPWGRTMSFVADRRFSGELMVDADGKRYIIGFDDGAVVVASSPLATDAAVRVALTAGLVTSSQVAEINRRVAAQPDLDEVEAVAAAARLGPDQTDRLRRRVIAHKAIRGFALERGDFVLLDERQLPFTPDHAIDVRALIYLGARTHMTEQRLLQELARVGPGFQLKPAAIETLPQYGFSEAEKPVLAALRAAPIAVLDLDAAATELDPRTVRAVVYALAVTNALDIAQTSVTSSRSSKPTPVGGMDRLRKPSSSQTQSERVRKPASSPGKTGEDSERRRAATSPAIKTGEDSERRRATTSPAIKTEDSERRRKASEDSERRRNQANAGFETRTPSKPTLIPGFDRTRRSSTTTPAEPRRPASGSTSDPGFSRGRSASSIPIAMPSADDSGATRPPGARTRTSAITPTAAAAAVLDAKAHRRPARRSSIHQINIPVAGEGRALIVDRSAQVEEGAAHFALLGVGVDASAEEIRKMYFGLARQLHPDRLTALGIVDEDRAAQRLFAQINTAFAVLSSPARRAEYRRTLQAGGENVVRAQQDQAEAITRRVLAAEEKFRIGEMALRRDQLDVALTHFKQAVELNPDEADHHALLGWTIFVSAADKTTVVKEARGKLEQAARMAPKAVAPRLYLGRMARMLGRDKDAIAQFNEVLLLQPGHNEATSELRVLEGRKAAPKETESKGLFGRFRKP